MIEGELGMAKRIQWETTPLPVRDDAEELEALMSLALDGLLEEEEALRLDVLLAADAGVAAEWQSWQSLDAALRRAPVVEPSSAFLAGVEHKIAQWERRRRLRTGIMVGVAAVLLWGSALVALFSLGAFFLANQAVWLNELIHGIAIGWVWVSGMARMVWSAATHFAATPEALALGVCYGMLAAVMLGFWIRLLRKTTRTSEPFTV